MLLLIFLNNYFFFLELGTEFSINTVGSSADKSINILDYDCLAKIFMFFPPVQRIKLENGKLK